MADYPTPRSYAQIRQDMIDSFLSRYGIPSLQVGSPILALIEAAAQSDTHDTQDIFQLLNAQSLDRATGTALYNRDIAQAYPPTKQTAAYGYVTITDSTYTKLYSTVYAGQPLPVVGTTDIYVKDASTFPATGTVYIGFGTENYEGPLAYTSVTNSGDYWIITLSTATARAHNADETVVVGQGGDRLIAAGTQAQTANGNAANAIIYETKYDAIIPDGEMTVSNVLVVAKTKGSNGNVPPGAINSFVADPFTGAIVTNPLRFSNGRDAETIEEYRDRLRTIEASRVIGGVDSAIEYGVLGLTSSTDNKRITSSKLVKRVGEPTVLYIDDGNGYEPSYDAIPSEPLVEAAVGGEQYFKLSNVPVAKAFVQSISSAPFTLTAGAQLRVIVGDAIAVHYFEAADFRDIGAATAYEIAASINRDNTLAFGARTVNSGTQVALFSKAHTNEYLKVTTAETAYTDANDALGFTTTLTDTLWLYRNDVLLSRDGKTATLMGNSFSEWKALIGNQTLTLSVDGTASTTYTITDQDFVDAGTKFTSVGPNSLDAWASVLNYVIPGVTVTVNGNTLLMKSNLANSFRSKLIVSGGTLINNGVFNVAVSIGKNSDYTLDRFSGDIKLKTPLNAGDSLSVGTANIRQFIESGTITGAPLTSDLSMWFVVDGGGAVVNTGITASTSFTGGVHSYERWGYRYRLTASSGAPFLNVRAGDWMIVWDFTAPDVLRGSHRVAYVDALGTYIDIEIRGLNALRAGHTFTKIATDKGLAVGGITGTTITEEYDHTTLTWTAVGSLANARYDHTATLLNTGKVLVTGGFTNADSGAVQATDTCELYDPTTKTWSLAAPLPIALAQHRATLLGDGTVLVTGGVANDTATTANNYSSVGYVYDPTTNTWSAAIPMVNARANHSQVLLPNGDALIAGGEISPSDPISTCEIYSHTAGTFSSTGALNTPRSLFGMAVLASGDVVAAGGIGWIGTITTLTSVETYSITGGTWTTSANSLNHSRYDFDLLVDATTSSLYAMGGGASTALVEIQTDGSGTGPWAVGSYANNLTPNYIIGARSAYIDTALLMMVGGRADFANQTLGVATSEILDTSQNQFQHDIGRMVGAFINGGIAFARTDKALQMTTLGGGLGYLAPTIAEYINRSINGAFAYVHNTASLRVRTNTFGSHGDVALVAATDTTPIALSPATAQVSDNGTYAYVRGDDTRTPHFFFNNVLGVNSAGVSVYNFSSDAAVQNLYAIREDMVLKGLKNTPYYPTQTGDIERYGSLVGYESAIASITPEAVNYGCSFLTLRTPFGTTLPHDRIELVHPYAISPDDTLNLMVDGSHSFSVPMGVKVSPTSATYGNTNSYVDAATGLTLANTFGDSFDFNDWAVFMHSRTVSHSTDPTLATLWRYSRLGADGDTARMYFDYPTAPNKALTISIDGTSATAAEHTDIAVILPSGAEKTSATINATTKFGLSFHGTSADYTKLTLVSGFSAASASRTGSTVTLTLTLPSTAFATVTDAGLGTGVAFYLNSSDANFPSGLYTTQAGTTGATVVYNDGGTATTTGTAIGTITPGYSETLLPTLAANDLVYFDDNSHVDVNVRGTVVQLVNVGSQYAQGYTRTQVTGNGVVTWGNDGVGGGSTSPLLTFFPLDTAGCGISTIISSVAAISYAPMTGTFVGTTPTGSVLHSTNDAFTAYRSYYSFADGINWVQTTTAPGTNYSLSFKRSVDASLAGSSVDWFNENIYLVPILPASIVAYMGLPSVSGLPSVGEVSYANGSVQLSSLTLGSEGSIQTDGGTANIAVANLYGTPTFGYSNGDLGYASILIPNEQALPFHAGDMVEVANNTAAQKATFTTATTLSRITPDGKVTLTNAFRTTTASMISTRIRVEKHGKYMAYFIYDAAGTTVGSEGDYVTISTPTSGTALSSSNQGTFPVVRSVSKIPGMHGFWIENPNGVEEDEVYVNATFYNQASLMPGDQIHIEDDFWGSGNKGTWTVLSIDSTYNFSVDVSNRPMASVSGSPGALGTHVDSIYVTEGTPNKLVKHIHSIFPSTDGLHTFLKFDTDNGLTRISENNDATVTSLDKLSFNTSLHLGTDGYKAGTGLLEEATKTIYGDLDNPAYPGLLASGADVLIDGPLIHNIKISLLVRTWTSVDRTNIENSVRGAVASEINRSGVGKSIAISDLVAAATTVNGVESVVVLSPSYNSGNDLISVQAYEKPVTLNPTTDITIKFVGD